MIRIFFLFVVKFEYLVTLSCIFCFVSPLRGFISHKICIIFQQREETIFLLPPWKLRFYSLLSTSSSNFEHQIALLEGIIKNMIIICILWIYYSLLFSWFIVPCYPLSILSLTVLYCSMIV